MSNNDQNPISSGNDDLPTLPPDTAGDPDVQMDGEIDLDPESQLQVPLPVDTHSAPLDHPAKPLPITAEEVLRCRRKDRAG